MPKTDSSSSPPSEPSKIGSRLFRWLDRRTGLDKLLRIALDEPIPGGARWAFIFGSGLLFLFMLQFITGVALALYYVPSADHAHITVAYITKVVTDGAFLRSLHSYGASAVVVVLFLHVIQVFTYGSYKGHRELLWMVGCLLFLLMFGMAFTGYLLPWDETAYFATAVGTNLISELPWVGNAVKTALRGGTEMGTMTISRFFVIHVLLLPAAILWLVAIHIYLFRKSHAAGPFSEDPLTPKQKREPFYPRQLLMDIGFVLVLVAALGILATFRSVPLGPEANPADTQYLPRPEWYFRPIFQWLRLWTSGEEIGLLILPTVLLILFFAVPFIDRRLERRPWKRPIAIGCFLFVLSSYVGLGAYSYWQDAHDPAVAEQIRKQQEAEAQYMREPFKPHLTGARANAEAPPANPLVSKGESVFQSQDCAACHGEKGVGTPVAPSLIGIGKKFTPDQLETMLKDLTPKMKAGGMPPVTVADEEMKALIAYLDSL
jgi:quinol-cytochrome oxidoreductase complex cytochrome b subunit